MYSLASSQKSTSPSQKAFSKIPRAESSKPFCTDVVSQGSHAHASKMEVLKVDSRGFDLLVALGHCVRARLAKIRFSMAHSICTGS